MAETFMIRCANCAREVLFCVGVAVPTCQCGSKSWRRING